jgi:hypothetical protein
MQKTVSAAKNVSESAPIKYLVKNTRFSKRYFGKEEDFYGK